MDFSFLHCADIHLGGRFAGLAQRSDEAAQLFAGAAERALERMVDLALAEGVAFVLVAGDLYDGPWKDERVGLAAARAFGRLDRAGVRSFVIKGNHDAESRIAAGAALPPSVHVFGAEAPGTVELREYGVAVHGWSFADPAVRENMARRYPAAAPGRLDIGLLHTSLDGREGHKPYAPCSVEDLVQRGYAYWALGHVHGYEVVRRGGGREGGPWIVYPGALQGRSILETGAKGATIVRVQDGRITDVAFKACDVVRFARAEIDFGSAETDWAQEGLGEESLGDDGLGEDWRGELEPALRKALEPVLRDEMEGRPTAVRVILRGATAFDAALRRAPRADLAAFATEVAVARADELFVEKVEIATRPPAAAATAAIDPEFARALDEAAADAAVVAALAKEIAAIRGYAATDFDWDIDPATALRRARAALASAGR